MLKILHQEIVFENLYTTVFSVLYITFEFQIQNFMLIIVYGFIFCYT